MKIVKKLTMGSILLCCAVLWLKDSLAADGISLQVGDLLSLGTVTRPLPVKPGTRVVARYSGLDPSGPVSVSVSFR